MKTVKTIVQSKYFLAAVVGIAGFVTGMVIYNKPCPTTQTGV